MHPHTGVPAFVLGFDERIRDTMYTFKDAIKNEQRRILRLIQVTASPKDDEDTGSLSVEPRGSRTYCYLQRYKGRKRILRKYLDPPGAAPVRTFVGAKYRKELLARLHVNLEHLEKLSKDYLDYDAASIRAALPDSCQKVWSGSAFNERYEELRAWANAPYERNPAPFGDTENYAADGTRTRSKGETIFYNIFLGVGVLFRFDCVIRVIDERGREHVLCPDFLIKCFDGTYIAIEHLGWADGLSYGMRFGQKSYYYLCEGFILGKNYFVTSDDVHGGTDSRAIEEVALLVQRKFFGY